MPTPLELMRQYKSLQVPGVEENAALRICRPIHYPVSLDKYFMMSWTAGTDELSDYQEVTRAVPGRPTVPLRQWYTANRERITNAAMGKGAPQDYAFALEYAVRAGRIPNPNPASVQLYCDQHLGIDCSGFATNYLVAAGKKDYSQVANCNAQSYYSVARAVNDMTTIRQGDLLIWMTGIHPRSNPGHIAVVQSMAPFTPAPGAQGNLHVVQSRGGAGLCEYYYRVQRIIPPNDPSLHNAVMILHIQRPNAPVDHVSVMRLA